MGDDCVFHHIPSKTKVRHFEWNWRVRISIKHKTAQKMIFFYSETCEFEIQRWKICCQTLSEFVLAIMKLTRWRIRDVISVEHVSW